MSPGQNTSNQGISEIVKIRIEFSSLRRALVRIPHALVLNCRRRTFASNFFHRGLLEWSYVEVE